jgi:hypothetical protein
MVCSSTAHAFIPPLLYFLISSSSLREVMNDLHPFESPKLLIDRAKVSIDELEPLCNAFIRNCAYDVISYTDPKTGEHVVKIHFQQRIPPIMRLPASDALNNLRHALDQAVVDGAILLGRSFWGFGRDSELI